MSDNDQTDLLLTQYAVGDRIELAPATDRWMRGDQFGEIVKIGHRYLHVKMQTSGHTIPVVPENVNGRVV